MLRLGCDCSSALAVPLASISFNPSDPSFADVAGHTARISRRHPPFCAASAVGRMDRLGGNDTYYCEWYSDLRHAPDACQQKSQEEENCGERGDEWREFL